MTLATRHGATWQYEENGWHAFSFEGNDQIMEVFLRYLYNPSPANRNVMVTSAGVAREVDFELRQQKRCDTKKVRKIRFWPAVPTQWTTPADKLLLQDGCLQSFYVEVTDFSIHAKVQEILRSTGHARNTSQNCAWMQTATVKSVHRIENYQLWHCYKVKREAMRRNHMNYKLSVTPAALDLDAFNDDGPNQVMTESQAFFECGEALATDVDEKILLHGTSWRCANSIVRNGFDHRFAFRGLYGDGVYFASAACKSHQYTCHAHTRKPGCYCRHERTLIIARVALGDAYRAQETHKNKRAPPMRSDGGVYDSIVVNPGPIKGHAQQCQVHQEYVIFGQDQAYPCYVVQYELHDV